MSVYGGGMPGTLLHALTYTGYVAGNVQIISPDQYLKILG